MTASPHPVADLLLAARRHTAAATLCLAVSAVLHAHGGQYRGPSSVVPPSATSTKGPGDVPSGNTSSGGGSNNSSSSSSGSSAAPAAGTSPSGPRSGPNRGIYVDSDLTSWEYCWEFQKDPWLRVRDGLELRRALAATDAFLGRVATIDKVLEPPSAREVTDSVVPALLRALETATDRDTVSSCMIALAKIGKDPVGGRLHSAFASQLRSHDQEIRETAALAIGIARQCTKDDLDLLLALAADSEPGRRAVSRSKVDDRVRAFACYGLGLCLSKLEPPRQLAVVNGLLGVLTAADAGSSEREVGVGAIAAIAQIPHGPGPAAAAVRDAAIAGLLAFYAQPLGPGGQLVQAQCPVAIATLAGREHPRRDELRNRFAEQLRHSLSPGGHDAGKSNDHVAQSCAIALGILGMPWNDERSPDAAEGKLLVEVYRQHRDHQTRYFAAMAIGRLGGTAARDALLTELERGTRAIEQPWIAMSLGALVERTAQEQRQAGRTPEPDPVVGTALLRVFESAKAPSALSATAIALGLARWGDGADRLRDRLREYGGREDVGGQLALGLALLEDKRSAPALRDLLAQSMRKPQLLVQYATALGRLGDATIVDHLIGLLQQLDGGLARLSAVASALGQLGDRRSVAPLLQMLQDERLTPLTRAFAAVALGGVCDPDPLPWNARFAQTVNYRAAVSTLTDGQSGILDIL